MPETVKPLVGGKQLDSWKQIAAYLRVSVRTAYDWERIRGLPVHRMPGSKSRVIGFTEELDSWKEAIVSIRDRVPSNAARRQWRIGRRLMIVAALALILGASAVGYTLVLKRPSLVPASYEISDRDLVVLDARKAEIWRYSFPGSLFAPYYGDYTSRILEFADLRADGKVETLFAYYPVSMSETRGSLYCFLQTGQENWRFTPGREVNDRDRVYSNAYTVSDFLVAPGDRIVVSSHHVSYYPNEVAMLDSRGKVLGAYWHSGALYFIRLHDLDRDGIEEVILAGIDNSQRMATVVVLTLDSLSLTSAQRTGESHELGTFSPAREEAIVLFPRTCINSKLEEYNRVSAVNVAEDEIVVDVCELTDDKARIVKYHLTHDLRLKHADISDTLREKHRELAAFGILDHTLSESEIESLQRSIIVRRPSAPASERTQIR